MPRSRRQNPQKNRSTLAAKRPRPSIDLAALGDDEQHIDSASDSDDGDDRRTDPSSDEELDRRETLQEKKVRLAREYLEKIDAQSDDSSTSSSSSTSSDDENDGENQRDRLSRKLQRERQKHEGTLERIIADKVARHVNGIASKAATFSELYSAEAIHSLRGHDLTPTCVAMVGDEKAVSGSKDHSVLLWDLERQCRLSTVCPHWKESLASKTQRTSGQVLTVASSDDGHYLAVGRRDSTVEIFDLRASTHNGKHSSVKTFEGHKGPVTCTAFRSQSHQLFSASNDRCIRHYNLDEMMYMETLYGHQFGVTDLDCARKERPVSVGLDRTARAWKMAEDTHLIFRGGARVQAADCVSILKDDWFLTGHQDGHLALWMMDKKKAVASVEQAHGCDEGLGRSICCVSAFRVSDLAATGSHDGHLRLWKVQTSGSIEERGVREVAQIPISGYVNSIAFGPKARFCVAAVGQEHRLGRWNRISKAKNRVAVFKLHDADLIEQDDRDVDGALSGDNSVSSSDRSRVDDGSSTASSFLNDNN